MSGIVGIFNLDGAPVKQALLGRMTDFMTFRGPDEQRVWVDGHVGFGHTLLRTTEESANEHQPFTLGDQVWIVADARVDAQHDLIGKLEARGEHVERGATDVELLLRAYRTWGEECVEHLLGDFAFAVWDGPKRRLFCARDHLGVKPFFYAQIGQSVIFSNTLDCIRQHPVISEKLNDLAIADFLLFDLNQEPTTTSFADIQRIPPAHRATWNASGVRVSRYWTMPIDEPVYFKQAKDYTDRFIELLDMAVSDRLRTNKIGVFMSGGLDSPTLAATACKILRSRSSDSEVRAFTTVIDGFDGNERHYAGLVAEWLKIPIHFRDRGAQIIDRNWSQTPIHSSEPNLDPMNLAGDRQEYLAIAAHSRVLFYGEGPDNALKYEWKPYLSHLIRKRQFGRLASEVCRHMIRHRRIPLVSTIPRMLRDRAQADQWISPFPDWLDESLETRLKLRARWNEQDQLSSAFPLHPVRSKGYKSLQTPLWDRLFVGLDAGEIRAPIETRHPLVDLRLLRYMLAVPTIPWCRSKYLVRRSMRGLLPAPVLGRPKSPLIGDPGWDEERRSGLAPLDAARGLSEYVNCERVRKDAVDKVGLDHVNFRPVALNYWLHNLRQEPNDFREEELNNGFIKQSA